MTTEQAVGFRGFGITDMGLFGRNVSQEAGILLP